MTQRDYDHDVYQIRTMLLNDRASVMVGSGFSFNAQKRYASAASFPSWRVLTESLVERLYPNDTNARCRALQDAGATSGALRLAQEFEAAFGRTVLLNHLRDMLPDREHEPGLLHHELLKLPWVDVFTTNYDTLLERAARPLRERRYEVVRCLSDLPLKRTPRIIKLHGTLPELKDCIFSEEDYRTYPERFGPFVAEVQVAMVESHLCLVGFSGDDPNFLAWSGWVRDRLRKYTLPIYLWTFNELATFQTRMLEERTIIPLPLPVITQTAEPEAALQAFLELLRKPLGKPSPRWCLPRNSKNEVPTLEPPFPWNRQQPPSSEEWLRAAFAWRANRNCYPGWIIPHVEAIESLWKGTKPWAERAEQNPDELSTLDEPNCIFVLSELLWRMRRAIFPIYDRLALTTIDQALQRYSTWRKEQKERNISVGSGDLIDKLDIADLDAAAMELRLERLRHARETGEFDRFKVILAEIDVRLGNTSREQREQAKHFQKHQIALAYQSTWNDIGLMKLLSEWDTQSAPLWALRRAALLIEMGSPRAAEEILLKALVDLRTMADEGTPETWSIESWVICNLRSLARMDQFISPRTKEANAPQTEIGPIFGIVSERSGAQAYRLHDFPQTRTELPPSSPPSHFDLDRTLNWLGERSCDPEELLEWLEEQNSREYTRVQGPSRTHGFDSRRWTKHLDFGGSGSENRMVAAYRALRLIEDAGLPLRSVNVRMAAFPLAEKATRFLADIDAREATGAVLRSRSKDLINKWFARQRVATFPPTEVQRLHTIAESCARRLVQHPEALVANTDESRQFEAAIELLSRVAIRADDSTLQESLRFLLALPLRLRIWERWWLVDDLAATVRRVCDGLSTAAFGDILPELFQLPVPGSPSFPAPPSHIRWVDPVELLDSRETQPGPSMLDNLSNHINATNHRIIEIADDPNLAIERRYLVLRLTTLAAKGLLNTDQRQRFAEALYARRDPQTGFPLDTGCLDSVVLLAPPVDGVDEHSLFSKKYTAMPWPEDRQAMYSLLGSLARTGPVLESHPGGRLRGIDWSTKELREIAKRCHVTIEQQAKVVLADRDANLSSKARARVFSSTTDWAEALVERVVEVIDEVLLQRKVVLAEVWKPIVAGISQAKEARLPVLRAYPKLASFDSRFRSILMEEIISCISGGDEGRLTEGLSVLNHWANQLSDSRIPRIPDIVMAGVRGQLDAEYSPGLIHILDTIGNLFRRLPRAQAGRLLDSCEPGLGLWCRRLVYTSAEHAVESESHMRQELPDLRASMTRLCVIARKQRFTSEVISGWLESVRDDHMPEVRRSLVEQDP